MTSSSIAAHEGATTVDPIDRLPKIQEACGLKKSQLYLNIKTGLFTPPVKLGPRASGWPRSEVAALNAARIAGKTNDEIRALVQKLVAARTALA